MVPRPPRLLRAAPARKRFGQHFLERPWVDKVVAAIAPQPGDVFLEIGPGTGALMRDGLTKLAVYKDESGATHKCSAICTHLGCLVSWNDVEKTWDCPCHGARYNPMGKVVMGPAVADLSPMEE